MDEIGVEAKWFADLIETGDLLRGHGPVRGLEVFREVFQAAQADDAGNHARLAEQVVEGGLGDGGIVRLRDSVELVDGGIELFRFHGPGPGLFHVAEAGSFREGLVAAVLAAEEAAVEGAEDEDGDVLVEAGGTSSNSSQRLARLYMASSVMKGSRPHSREMERALVNCQPEKLEQPM